MNAHDQRFAQLIAFLLQRDGVQGLTEVVITVANEVGIRGWLEEALFARVSNARAPMASHLPDETARLKAQLEMCLDERFPPWQRPRRDDPGPDAT